MSILATSFFQVSPAHDHRLSFSPEGRYIAVRPYDRAGSTSVWHPENGVEIWKTTEDLVSVDFLADDVMIASSVYGANVWRLPQCIPIAHIDWGGEGDAIDLLSTRNLRAAIAPRTFCSPTLSLLESLSFGGMP